MKDTGKKFSTVDEYISSFPKSTQVLLQQIRNRIRKSAPRAEETISYNMPAFKLKGMLVYYAGYRSHIGFYPMPSGIEAFKDEVAKYKSAKSTVQFPLDEPLPLSLIGKIVKFRVQENLEKAAIR